MKQFSKGAPAGFGGVVAKARGSTERWHGLSKGHGAMITAPDELSELLVSVAE